MEWKNLFGDNILRGGQEYVDSGAVHNISEQDGIITGDVTGLEEFHVKIRATDNSVEEFVCSCPYAQTGAKCKHMAAVMLSWETFHGASENANNAEVKDDFKVEEAENKNIHESENVPRSVLTEGTDQAEEANEEPARFISAHDGRITLQCDVNSFFVYALYENKTALIRSVTIKNNSDEDISELKIRIRTDEELIESYTQELEELPAGEEFTLKNIQIRVHGEFLASLTERILCNLYISITQGENELVADSMEITVLAYDQWPGLRYSPDLLAAYVTPNHPAISGLSQTAARYLGKWTSDPSLNGYQSNDPNRIVDMAAAAFAAIQELNITYAALPASFEDLGQRVRLISNIMDNRLGNCMDITLLYVAVLEAMDLNPLMIMVDGHIFAGLWLIDDTFSDPYMDDPSQLEKRTTFGIDEIIMIECTAVCAGKNVQFTEATERPKKIVNEYKRFEFAIDIKRARRSGIRPIPMMVKGEREYIVEHKDRTEDEVTDAPSKEYYSYNINPNAAKNEKVTKQVQWERKLLDLSLRNMLINMRITRSVVPLLGKNLSAIENDLSDGSEFEILHRPVEWNIHKIEAATDNTINDLGPYEDLIELERQHKRIHSWCTESELNKLMTKMYRTANTSLEENGASTLYLTLGRLRWSEGIKNPKHYYAPVLLIPIEIIRKSATKGFVIRMRDEEAHINITLLEFLKQRYKIEIPGLTPIPMDEHGVDVKKIFAIIRQAIMGRNMWDIVEDSFIGNFSFSQFVMWNDIHTHPDKLADNKIIRALINGYADWDRSISENVFSDDAYLPVPVDASQIRAINMAANDVSFVLHGPPGTGKSQTITAMIANALAKGKTVLFVAEKMAALEVVQKRLMSLGIGDFCLELHSNKAVKKNVLDQLKKGIDLGVWGIRTDYDQRIDDIHKMREELDDYAKKLHEKHQCGMSVRELIDAYEAIPEQKKRYKPDKDFIASVTKEQLEKNKLLLERVVVAGKAVGNISGHIFSNIGQTEYSQSYRKSLEDALYRYEKSVDEFDSISEGFLNATGESKPVSEADWMYEIGLAESIINGREIPDFILCCENLDDEFSAPLTYISYRNQYIQQYQYFYSRYKESALQIDFANYGQRYIYASKKLFGKVKAIASITAELQQHMLIQAAPEYLSAYENEIQQFMWANNNYNNAKAAVPEYWNAYLDDGVTFDSLQNLKFEWEKQLEAVRTYSDKLATLKMNGSYENCIDSCRRILGAYYEMKDKEEKVKELLQLSNMNDSENYIEDKKEFIYFIDSHSSELRDWITYQEIREECIRNGLEDICKEYANGLEHDSVIPVYFKNVYKDLIWSIIENEPVLDKFKGSTFNEKISQYKKMEEKFIKLTKEEIYYKLTHNLPTGHENAEIAKEIAILRKAISSGGRGLSIRNLFDQIPHVLLKICPCFLMSPISVSQYLSLDNDKFDVVIFDEASQLPTCKAVGVLARGNNAVIVGDPNQMPPTSFFAGNMIDEDNLDIEDLDSVLDDCLALNMPGTHLQWHYRSRHESLIAFSNQEYYANSMLTFPSVNDRERRVKLCTVDGVFNRKKGRINEEEGTAVVKEVLRRYHNYKLNKQSIGIVTFNITQQGLIEDLLAEEYKKDAEFDKWANEKEERLFVKNLENVQGDERDVILFSVGFGPDEERKLSLNFGPLNKEGGWKRLNVAVSRARLEMIVFSSMTADMIDLSRTKSKGVEGLRAFLEFAEKGRLSGMSHKDDKKNQGIAKRICESIENAGYKVQRNVGHSDFKIDIAVVNPYDEEEYLLGILLDGTSYIKAKNTKDREVAQASVLGGLGWKLHRVWALDWWDNKEKEISTIMDIIARQDKEAKKRAEENEKDLGPESDDIFNKVLNTAPRVREKKEKEKLGENQSFDTHERFTPIMPHHESVDELNEYIDEKKHTEEIQAELETTGIDYELQAYESSDVTSYLSLSTTEFAAKSNKDEVTRVLNEIINKEAPISVDRIATKAARVFNIGRTSANFIDATDNIVKRLNFTPNKQNGVRFYWRKDQDRDTYPYYRVDATLEDKRNISDISQQEMKNVVCIVLKDKGALSKDLLIKETTKEMGYGRAGAAIVEGIERGIKYGRKTGEIIVDESNKYRIGR